MGVGGAKPVSPEPFMFEPFAAAPGGPVGVYSAIVTAFASVSVVFGVMAS